MTTDFSVDAWELPLDNDLWRNKKAINIYVQTTSQGDGERVTNAEPKPVYVLEVNEKTLDHSLRGLALGSLGSEQCPGLSDIACAVYFGACFRPVLRRPYRGQPECDNTAGF